MVNSNFSPQDKKPGDLILSADWNAAMSEIKRLQQAKVNREGADTLKGSLTIQEALNVTGDVKISGNRLKSADGLGIVETNKKDWLRINPDENYPAIALHKPVAIVSGGLAIGELGQQPQGVLKVTQSTYLATAGGNVGIGTIDAKAKLHIASGDLRLDANREIFFADNGQIRSVDNNHRIIFRRSEDKLELREFGDIIFSPGATAGNETAKVFLKSNGYLGIGTTSPNFHLEVGSRDTQGTWKLGISGKGSTGNFRQWTLRTGDGATNTEINKLRIRDEQANSDRITVDENGNVMFTGTVTATAFSGIGAFVRGMILMWSGMPTEIPQG
ncbi:MAG: hypothetical protein V7K41_15290 [Nostoc sp.]|uniref:hypothetical protein n=1 Tax=Nostoc sp. TaxID=1180 RepID=UPI002FFB71B7